MKKRNERPRPTKAATIPKTEKCSCILFDGDGEGRGDGNTCVCGHVYDEHEAGGNDCTAELAQGGGA